MKLFPPNPFWNICCAAALLTTPAARAQQGPARRALPLAEAVQLALATSQNLRRNGAAQHLAAARLQQAKNGLTPGVQVSSSFLRLSDNVTPFSVVLPGAGDVVLNPQVLDQSYNSLRVRQLLWDGGRVRLVIEAARREQAATQAEADQYRLLAADNVTGLWYELYTLNAAERILLENTRLLQDRRRELASLERQGVVLKIDGLKIDLAIARLASSLADVRGGQAVNGFNRASGAGRCWPRPKRCSSKPSRPRSWTVPTASSGPAS